MNVFHIIYFSIKVSISFQKLWILIYKQEHYKMWTNLWKKLVKSRFLKDLHSLLNQHKSTTAKNVFKVNHFNSFQVFLANFCSPKLLVVYWHYDFLSSHKLRQTLKSCLPRFKSKDSILLSRKKNMNNWSHFFFFFLRKIHALCKLMQSHVSRNVMKIEVVRRWVLLHL